MGFESLKPASRKRLVEIASQAYGSGGNEGVKGGAGRIGILTGSDGRTHVVKFNTNLGERLFGSSKTDSMIDSCNRLRTELVNLAAEAGLDDREMAKIRAKLGLDNGTDRPKSLLDRTIVAQVVTMIGKESAQSDVWNVARTNAEKSSKDMSFETVAARQAFGTRAATAEKVMELGKLGLTLDSLKQAVDKLAEKKGLSPEGKGLVFSQMADLVFTLCGKKGPVAAREAEVRETLGMIADGTHPLLLDETAMTEYLKDRVEATMRVEPVTADALFALFKESSALINIHCQVSGVQVNSLASEEDDLVDRTVLALLKGSDKLKALCAEGPGGAYAEVHDRVTFKDDPVLMRISGFCGHVNRAVKKIDEDDNLSETVGKIGVTLEQFRSVLDEVRIPQEYRERFFDRCREKIGSYASDLRAGIEKEGIGRLRTFIEKTLNVVKKEHDAELREKYGPALNWGEEIARFGGVFAKDEESRETGIALMKKFHGWFAKFVKSMKGRLPGTALTMSMEDGFRFLMFRELSLGGSVTGDQKKMFEENPLMALARKGLIGHGCVPMVLLAMPPEKRQVIYAAVAALPGPCTDTTVGTLLFCRIVHHLDKVQEKLATPGRLDARSLFTAIFPDFEGEIQEPLTTKQFETAYESIQTTLLEKYNPNTLVARSSPKSMQIEQLLESGRSFEEVVNVMEGGPVEPEEYPVRIHLPLSEFSDDLNAGKSALAADICRPTRVDETGKSAYTFRFPNGTAVVSEYNPHETREDRENLAGQVVKQVVNLCGPDNLVQINLVEAHMCQAGFPGDIGDLLKANGYDANEHIALTFSLSRNEETGAVTIHYSEPEGCKLSISADVTIHPNGRIERSDVKYAEKKLG